MTQARLTMTALPRDDLPAEQYVNVPEQHLRRVEAFLAQSLPWQDRAPVWELFNGHYLAVTDRRKPAMAERVIDLAYLNPSPRWVPGDLKRRVQIAAALAATALLAMIFYPDSAVSLLLLAVVLTALLLLATRPGAWEFRTAIGDVTVCRIPASLMRRAESEAFVALVAERADGARVILPSGSRRIAAEMAEHRRMLEHGVLSVGRYQIARQRLLARLQQAGGRRSSEIQLA
jgi:hypothetical protein